MFAREISEVANELVKVCNFKKIALTTAESCTGGLVAAAITEVPGASSCLRGGLVTYSNFMKTRWLGVSEETLEKHGAVSEQTAREMAHGALKAATSDISVAITGIAGPTGGSPEKPVGTVHFATAHRTEKGIQTHHERHYIQNQSRTGVRLKSVEIALKLLLQEAENI